MFRVRLYNTNIKETTEELNAFLKKAGCALLDPVTHEREDALLVLLYPDLLYDPELEARLIQATRDQVPICCIWPKDATGAGVPRAIDNYSKGEVGWNPARVRMMLEGKEEPIHENPDGTPRPEPETERHPCDDE